ncbi:MAG: hypothetical protein U0527_13915 [Candidatus Eisenbacteria bacterium]
MSRAQWLGIAIVALLFGAGLPWGLPSAQRAAIITLGARSDSLALQVDASAREYFELREAAEARGVEDLEAGRPLSGYMPPRLPSKFSNADKLAVVRRYAAASACADERQAYVALARVKPRQGDFDLRGVPYGGAMLYPLGITLFLLRSAGLLDVSPQVSSYLADPTPLRRMYEVGRLFAFLPFLGVLVLLAAFGTALGRRRAGSIAMIIWTLSSLPQNHALLTKPHMWATFWVLLGVYALYTMRGAATDPGRSTSDSHRSSRVVLAGVSFGLAVGAAVLTVGIGALLLGLAVSGWTSRRAALLCAAIATITALLVNPYVLLAPGRAFVTTLHFASDYHLTASPVGKLLRGGYEMLVRGFAFPFGLVGLIAIAAQLRRGDAFQRPLAIAWLLCFLEVALVSGEMRYALFVAPFLCLGAGRVVDEVLAVTARRIAPLAWTAFLLLLVPGAVFTALFVRSVVDSESWHAPLVRWLEEAPLARAAEVAVLDNPEPENLPPLPVLQANLVGFDPLHPPEQLPELVLVGGAWPQEQAWSHSPVRERYALERVFDLGPLQQWALALRMRSSSHAAARVYRLRAP